MNLTIDWIKDWEHNEKKAQKFKCRCMDCYEELRSIIKLDGRA